MPKVEDSNIGSVVSWLSLLVLFALCWYWGFEIGVTALADPDTCWLLAVGRLILANGAVPHGDPFSWTLTNIAGTYVPYQWLATIVFYGLYSTVGPKCLLLLVSLIVLLSFLVLPLCLARKAGTSLLVQGLISVLAVSAASFHFLLRPELFSYLSISLLIYWVMATLWALPWTSVHAGAEQVKEAAEKTKQGSATAGATGDNQAPAARAQPGSSVLSLLSALLLGIGLFVLWANVHTGFVLGLVILAAALLSIVLSWLAAPAQGKCIRDCGGKLTAFLAGALIGSVVTPFQLRLYAYLPQLFFSPMNKFNQELLPLRLNELLSFDFLPFLILQLAFFASIVLLACSFFRPRRVATESEKRFPALVYEGLFCFFVLTLISFIAGDLCRRMIPFAVLISCPYFVSFLKAGIVQTSFSSTRALPLMPTVLLKLVQVDQAFNKLIAGRSHLALTLAACLVCVALGTGASASTFPVTVPQTTRTFDVPIKAVDFLQRSWPPGNMLNDPQFGDVLIFSLGERARVFIDTRFDLYGPAFCRDYFTMANCLDGYEKLMADYKIDWIFFPLKAPIVGKLSKTAGWRIIYGGNASADTAPVIMVRERAVTH